ncbi:MAG: class I SAM-dependent methyltransferase [bacterium]|nr:class I SAM-dependent methyltransferase [bacterium]
MNDYYARSLSAERLEMCYTVAPPRVQCYFEAEIAFVCDRIMPSARVLDLGCGYGRVTLRLLAAGETVVGIDNSRDNLALARKRFRVVPSCYFLDMNAAELGFRDRRFDVVACIQNGISAFKVDQRTLLEEAVRVTRPGGTVLFSTYSDRFWKDRLEWFEIQADHGLIGEIDYEATGDGVIVCKDGFRATTVGAEEFLSLTSDLDVTSRVIEVDGSSIFCEILVG